MKPLSTPISVKVDGVTAQVLQPGEKAKLTAKAGARYRLVRQGEGKEVLADGLLATREGDDLQLSFTNGSELTLEAFFPTCKAQSCGVELPSAQGAQLLFRHVLPASLLTAVLFTLVHEGSGMQAVAIEATRANAPRARTPRVLTMRGLMAAFA
jgi:hypothetical protein